MDKKSEEIFSSWLNGQRAQAYRQLLDGVKTKPYALIARVAMLQVDVLLYSTEHAEEFLRWLVRTTDPKG